MPRLQQALALARLLPQPGALQAFRSWKPFSITAFQMLRDLRRLGLRPRTIIDAGANVGQFARAAAETFPEARVVAFEPLPEVAQQARDHLADCPRAEVVVSAVGSEDGTLTFHRHAYSLASSALPAADGTAAEELTVPVTRLDTYFDDAPLASPVLLKLDLQGFELEALKGATMVLAQTDHVLFEASFDELYEGAPPFHEIEAFLQERGFRFRRPVAVLRRDDGVITEMDALFERASLQG